MRQNSVQFGKDFTRARKNFTQALLALFYVFPSLSCSRWGNQNVSNGMSVYYQDDKENGYWQHLTGYPVSKGGLIALL